MGNAKTKSVPIKKIIASHAFKRGFADKKAGRPIDERVYYEHQRGKSYEWNYERGRQFAVIYDKSLTENHRITRDALYRYSVAVVNSWIV
jgi:hypothetical protein